MVGFPLLLIPLAIYNIIVFLMPDVSFTDPLVKLTLVSGAEWTVTLSDVLLTLAILLLLAEVIKGARPGVKYLTDHLLSLIVFGAAAAEFVMLPKFATSTFFLMTALSLVDFVSGLALRTRRRAVAVRGGAAAKSRQKRSRCRPPSPTSIPRRRRLQRPAAVPAATSVAESVLQDPPEPKPTKPAVTPEAASVVPEPPAPKTPSLEASSPEISSTEIPSRGLQPGSGSPPSPDKPQH